MKSIKSVITIIALVATAFGRGQASAESITVTHGIRAQGFRKASLPADLCRVAWLSRG